MQIEMGKEYLKKEPGKTDEYLDRCANAGGPYRYPAGTRASVVWKAA